MKIVILVSNTGTGTNLASIASAVKEGRIKAEISAVIADRTGALALEHAKNYNLPIEICEKKENLLSILQKLNPDFVCLAGWKQIVPDKVVTSFKVLNLHPGLIPDTLEGEVLNPDGTKALWNKGKLADKAIANFLEQKSTYAGSSIHFLTLEFDFGPVLGRAFEKIEDGDKVESLYTRLKKKENEMYVEVLEKLCNK